MNDRAHDLSNAVRTRRHRLGLRQEQLAELAGCSTRFVHSVEAGKQTLRLDKLVQLLAALGLGLVVRQGAAGVTAESGEPLGVVAGGGLDTTS